VSYGHKSFVTLAPGVIHFFTGRFRIARTGYRMTHCPDPEIIDDLYFKTLQIRNLRELDRFRNKLA